MPLSLPYQPLNVREVVLLYVNTFYGSMEGQWGLGCIFVTGRGQGGLRGTEKIRKTRLFSKRNAQNTQRLKNFFFSNQSYELSNILKFP